MTSRFDKHIASSALLLALSLLPAAAVAASFDCAAARSPTERTICDDAELSALDEQLDQAYRVALKKQVHSVDRLRAGQRAWWKSLQSGADPVDQENLKAAYQERIEALAQRPSFPAAGTPMEGPTLSLKGVARQYDFSFRMLDACSPETEGGSCEGPGRVLVHRKGQSKVMQTIDMDNIFLSFAASGQPLVNSARLYDHQGVINVGDFDFDFDGHEDFGIQNGNHGSYGGPSYDIYLFDPKLGRFTYSTSMSELIESTLGFFRVDVKRKRLTTFAKSGCCYHESTVYRVVLGEPVPVTRHIEALMPDGERMEITEERLVGGKWRRKVHYVPL